LLESLSVVAACLRIINTCRPKFWALENPVGRLPRFIGKYKYTFQPYEYGDPWTKRTCIWGEHNRPVKCPVEIKYRHADGSPSVSAVIKERFPSLVSSGSGYKRGKKELPVSERNYPSWTGGTPSGKLGVVDRLEYIDPNWVHNLGPSKDRAALRSITPPGFAKAFFEANP
jgi:hypothetical protein